MAKNFLFEIGTEEIPAGYMPSLLQEVKEVAIAYLEEHHLGYGTVRALGTPRRVALLIEEVAEKAEDKTEKAKGPSVSIAFDAEGNPTKAAIGFAKGKGIEASALTVEDGYVYAEMATKGEDAKVLLSNLMATLVKGLHFSKSMRWADYEERFARPIRWFVALLGEEVLPFSYASATSSNVTRGHRFLGEREFVIPSPESYVDTLRTQFVLVDQEERGALIKEQLEAIAKEQGGTLLWDEDLFEEVLYLVEYPTALCGSFAESYLELPTAAVVTPMKDHQRYFPMVDGNGKLMPLFVTVRNGGSDFIDTVRAGNERVLRARLDDAVFFFNEDRKVALADRSEKLKTIVFQEGLGNLLDKSERLQKLSAFFGKACGLSAESLADLDRAAVLSKADLTTAMVTEFTELQGEIGKDYALLDGESAGAAEAIFEQYLPRFSGDMLPASDAGAILSMVDKVDNVVATFSRGLIPTGSQDPFALRRQSIGILLTLIQKGWHVSLRPLLLESMVLLGVEEEKKATLLEQVESYMEARLRNIYSDRNWAYTVIEFLLGRKEWTVVGNEGLGEALMAHRLDEEEPVVQAYLRIFNLVKEKARGTVEEGLFKEEVEKTLFAQTTAALAKMETLLSQGLYKEVVLVPATLVDAINAFFEGVMVMDKEEAVKENRLYLLREVHEVMALLGDVSAFK